MKISRLKPDQELGFSEARTLANQEAGKYRNDPMMLG